MSEPHSGASSATLNDWLRVVMSAQGPKPQRLSHACHVLAWFMRGDGADGCFPSLRTVAVALKVSYRTAGRDLAALERQGWTQTEAVRRQFGKRGRRYFPAIPDGIEVNGTRMAVPIEPSIVTPSVSQSPNGTNPPAANGTNAAIIGTNSARIVTPSVSQKSLTEISNSEGSAAPPAPANAGSAAPEPEPMTDQALRDQVRILRRLRGWTDARILDKYAKRGMTADHLTAPAEAPDTDHQHTHTGERHT